MTNQFLPLPPTLQQVKTIFAVLDPPTQTATVSQSLQCSHCKLSLGTSCFTVTWILSIWSSKREKETEREREGGTSS